jgi:hypothetical protein
VILLRLQQNDAAPVPAWTAPYNSYHQHVKISRNNNI